LIKIITFRPEEKFKDLNVSMAKVTNIPITKIVKNKIDEFSFMNDNYDYIIFTSSMAVESFKDQVKNFREFLNGKKIVAIGNKTAESIGMDCIVPSLQSSEGILETIKDNSNVLLIRSENGNPYLVKKLKQKCNIKIINAYRSEILDGNFKDVYDSLKNGYFDATIFTSSMIFNSYITIFSQYGNPLEILPKIIIAIGSETARSMKKYSLNPMVMEIPDVEYSIKKIVEIYQKYGLNQA